MPDYQLLSCNIMLAGSKDSVVWRGPHNPLSYPEILIMCFMHGDDAVTDVEEVGTLSMSNIDLLHHLTQTYPILAVQQCFPGARPTLPTRSDEFKKARAVLMAAQDARDAARATPGPAPGPENMTVPPPTPKPAPHREPRSQHAAHRASRAAGGTNEGEDAGPFAQ